MSWAVPRLWEGGECWILGGGPSLPKQFDVPNEVIEAVWRKELPLNTYSPYLSPIHDKHVIGVNMAFMIGDWIDVLFWGDKKWYLNNRHLVAKFKGLKTTCHPYFNTEKYKNEGVRHLAKDNQKSKGISSSPGKVSWNGNSGAAAISIAANMGATKIILVGFDMTLSEKERQHWHSEYGTAQVKNRSPKNLPFNRHLIGFLPIAKDARQRKITIINASPDSAIVELPKMSVKDVLSGAPIPKNPPLPDKPPRDKAREEERMRRKELRAKQRRRLEKR